MIQNESKKIEDPVKFIKIYDEFKISHTLIDIIRNMFYKSIRKQIEGNFNKQKSRFSLCNNNSPIC